MTNQEFVEAVRKKLASKELPDDFISDQCDKLSAKIAELPNENASKYTSEQNVDIFAEKIHKKFSISLPDSESSDKPEDIKPEEKEIKDTPPSPKKDDDSGVDKTRTVAIPKVSKKDDNVGEIKSDVLPPSPVKTPRSSDMVVIFDNSDNKKKRGALLSFGDGISSENEHPNLLFAALLVMLAPVGILAIAAAFAGFLGVFLVLAASIIGIIAVIIAVVAAGSLVSVASLLYGATQIISTPRFVGIHEIGLGLLVAGITILVSVILYNIALRLVPFIYSKLISFIFFCIKKSKVIFIKAKKGCENL